MRFAKISTSIIVLFLLFIPIVLSEENVNETTDEVILSVKAQEVLENLQELELVISEMKESGLPVRRYNDTLIQARYTYEAKLAEEQEGVEGDYSLVEERIEELIDLRRNAFKTSDEIRALKLAIEETTGIDLGPIWELYDQAEKDFVAERYEKSLEEIDHTYQKISELKAVQTKLKVFYDATSRTISGFFVRNWKILLIIVSAISITTLFTYKRIIRKIIIKKIDNLERRKKSVKKLTAETQKGYFDHAKINEETYHVRMKKYGDLMRDLNRQTTILRESLAINEQKKKSLYNQKISKEFIKKR